MLQRVCFSFVLALCVCASPLTASAQVTGDTAIVYNTLIDAQTGGAEIFTASATSTIFDMGLEFDDYLGLYDVDFTGSDAVMTLIGNSALDGVPLLFPGDPNPRFDTYYYFFDNHDVTSITLDAASGDLAEFARVGLVPAGDLVFANETFTNANVGMFIEFGPGTDYTDVAPANPDATVGFSFTTQAVPEPGSGTIVLLSMISLGIVRRRQG